MSTLLELARAVKRESGLGAGGNDPVSFASATGDDLRIFHWVIQSWRTIDLLHEAWAWRRDTATGTTNGSCVLNPSSDFGLAYHASWLGPNREYKPSAYVTADGVATEHELQWLSYDQFRKSFLTGSHTPGPLSCWSIAPNGDMLVGPIPDQGHTVRADYIKGHIQLAADGDIPAMPARFHDLIVWRALLDYGGYDAASEVAQRADINYRQMMPGLSQAQLPNPRWGGRPL